MNQFSRHLTEDDFKAQLTSIRQHWLSQVDGEFKPPENLNAELIYYLDSTVTTMSLAAGAIEAKMTQDGEQNRKDIVTDCSKIQEHAGFCHKVSRLLESVTQHN